MAALNGQIYDFGDWCLDSGEHLLLRKGERIPLSPKVFNTLLLLVENAGRLVYKDEFMRRIWPDAFVDEAALAQNISVLRKTLGSSVTIETVPKNGYRLKETPRANPISQVVVAERKTAPAAPNLSDKVDQSLRAARYGGRVTLSTAIVAALALTAVYFYVRHRTANASAQIEIRSLAVLPLQDLSTPSQEYFADGMTDELITDLAKIPGLRVTSRTSVVRYKGTKLPLPQIAKELGVDGLIEGTVLWSGNTVRVRAQLLDGPADRHIWAEAYERRLNDALALQADVARDIAQQVRISLTPEQLAVISGKYQASREVIDAYLRGRSYWNRRTEEDLFKAIGFFNQAITADPHFAPAFAGMADCYVLMPFYSGQPPVESIAKAEAAAKQALALDSNLAEAWDSYAYAAFLDWNFRDAEQGFQRALVLNPNYATAHQWHAEYLSVLGRHEEAISEIRRAQQLDPLNFIMYHTAGQILQDARRYDEALEEYDRARKLNSEFYTNFWTMYWPSLAYIRKGEYGLAVGWLKFAAQSQRDTDLDSWVDRISRAVTSRGKQGFYREFSQFHQTYAYRQEVPSAMEYAELGEKDRAIALLETAYRRHDNTLLGIAQFPEFDSLRLDPRFQDLLKRIGFPLTQQKQ